jgi:hypothetical protein
MFGGGADGESSGLTRAQPVQVEHRQPRGNGLQGGYLKGCKANYAVIANVDLTDADLSGCDLLGADLHNARIFLAQLSKANLSGANLKGVTLAPASDVGSLASVDLYHEPAESAAEIKYLQQPKRRNCPGTWTKGQVPLAGSVPT